MGIVVLGIVLLGVHCTRKQLAPPRTASSLSIIKYMGVWNEIARLPFPFEDDCYGAGAKYEMLEDDKFLITNYCWQKSFFGPMRRSQAEAWIPDPAEPGKLKVSFFWPFFLDYWVIYVDDNYQHALVGTPDRKYMWILSRRVRLDEAVYRELLALARSEGFEVSDIIRSPQREGGQEMLDPEEGAAADAGARDAGDEVIE